MLCVIDEFTREALAIRVKRRLNSTDVLETLADQMILRGPPGYVRSDNGPEFIAKTLHEWIAGVDCEFRCNPAGDSDLKPATVPI